MYLDFTYFAKQDSDWLSISSLISMFGYRGGLDGEASYTCIYKMPAHTPRHYSNYIMHCLYKYI